MMHDQHELQTDERGYLCSRCSLRWQEPPVTLCAGAKVYGYTSIPWEVLATVSGLQRQKLKPADASKADGCYFREKDNRYIYLYRIDQAIPRREPTEKQKEAVAKMQAALKLKYSCERCGWYDSSHGQNKRRYHEGIFTRKMRDMEGQEQELHYCHDCWHYVGWLNDRHSIERAMAAALEGEPLIIDTETTGLPNHRDFQVVEVAVVNRAREIVFHSLVRPDVSMPELATRIHGLTDADLAEAPGFAQIWPKLCEMLAGHELWAYGAAFDREALISSAERFGQEIPAHLKGRKHWHCVMEDYADYYGEYQESRQANRWQELAVACYDLEVESNGYHRATEDALNALGVMQSLAARGGNSSAPDERPVYTYIDYGN